MCGLCKECWRGETRVRAALSSPIEEPACSDEEAAILSSFPGPRSRAPTSMRRAEGHKGPVPKEKRGFYCRCSVSNVASKPVPSEVPGLGDVRARTSRWYCPDCQNLRVERSAKNGAQCMSSTLWMSTLQETHGIARVKVVSSHEAGELQSIILGSRIGHTGMPSMRTTAAEEQRRRLR